MLTNNVNNFLNIVCSKIKYKPAREDIADELKSHIEEEKENYMLTEKNEKKAEEKVLLNMGNPQNVGIELNKIHKPKLEIRLFLTVIFMIMISILVTYSISNSIYKYNYGSEKWFIKNIVTITVSIILGVFAYFFDYTKLKKKSFIIYCVTSAFAIISIFLNNNSYISYINISFLDVKILSANILVPLYIIAFCGYFNNANKKSVIITILLALYSLFIVSYCNSMTYLVILFFSYIFIFFIDIFTIKHSKKYKYISFSLIIFICILVSLLCIPKYYAPNIIQIGNTKMDINDLSHYYQISTRRNILKNAKIIGDANIVGNLNNKITINEWANGLQDAESTETLDFIIGNYGILLGIMVIFAILYLSFRMIYDMKIIKDIYGKYIIIGLSAMFIVQSTLHILSNLTIIGVNSVTLPFISFSDYNIIINIVIIAFILSIYRRKNILIKEK